MTYAVRFEHVTKRYPRGWSDEGTPRYPSLRHDLASIGRRGKLRGPQGTHALEDLSFEVEEGESFALVGPNGAGKSTALKIVSRISYPTSGRVIVRGRVAALMEVGSGSHPELTGRENIWLYGQILGLNKADIRRRFDEIVEFAELGHAIDTPVKFFSSGMQLRLGFSIAAHLEPDVFVVDEALAVGDAGFQAKCVDRMTELVREGRTLIFVSHHLFMLEAVCDRGLFVLDGKEVTQGDIRDVLGRYMSFVDEGLVDKTRAKEVVGAGITLKSALIADRSGVERHNFQSGEGMSIRLNLAASELIEDARVSVGLSDGRRSPLVLCSMLERIHGVDLNPGVTSVVCTIDALPFAPRTYQVAMSVRDRTGVAEILDWTEIASFRVTGEGEGGVEVASTSVPWVSGPVRVAHGWTVERTAVESTP